MNNSIQSLLIFGVDAVHRRSVHIWCTVGARVARIWCIEWYPLVTMGAHRCPSSVHMYVSEFVDAHYGFFNYALIFDFSEQKVLRCSQQVSAFVLFRLLFSGAASFQCLTAFHTTRLAAFSLVIISTDISQSPPNAGSVDSTLAFFPQPALRIKDTIE